MGLTTGAISCGLSTLRPHKPTLPSGAIGGRRLSGASRRSGPAAACAIRLPDTIARRTLLPIAAVCFEGHDEPNSQQEGLYDQEYGRAGTGGLSLVDTGSEHSEEAEHKTKPT